MRAITRYLETLPMVGGDHDGEPFEVLPWERRFVNGTFRTADDSALSVARGNGKSALVAALACAVVDPDGPLTGNRRDVDVFASSFEQGGVVYADVLHMLQAKGLNLDDRTTWKKQDSANKAVLMHKASGCRVRCHGSDPAKAHGLRSYLALSDEPAQWEPGKRDLMRSAIRTGLGKMPGSRLISLGTKPRDGAHWFARALRGISTGYFQVHEAEKEDPPFQLRTWKKANPSLKHLPSLLAKIRKHAKDARSDPDELASFRALRLNLGGSEILESFLIDADQWENIEGDAADDGKPIWGVDLGTSAALSAISPYWPNTGRLASLCAFPSIPNLQERGLSDGVGRLYTAAYERKELMLTGGHAVNIADLLREALQRFGAPRAIVCDRWREAELRDALKTAKVPRCALNVRGMGYKDGAEDVRAFRRAVLEGDVVPDKTLLLAACVGEARTVNRPCRQREAGEGARRRPAAARKG